jgi:hypothetical protein
VKEEEEEGFDVIVGVVVKRGEENREVRKVVGEGRGEEEEEEEEGGIF